MAQLIKELIGHEQQKQQLLHMIEKDQMPSSLIFYGPEGVGKKTLVHALLQVLNCEQEKLACGVCSHCVRALQENNEMMFELKPEGKRSISVEQVRELHRYLSLKSLRKARFVVIDPADSLTVQASNALLKVLEEAPEQTYFFLITERRESLLATIRSRSQSIKFSKLTTDELKILDEFSELAIQWADGRLSLAKEFQEEKTITQLNESLKFLYSLLCEAPQDWKKVAPWFFTDDDSRLFSFNIWNQALVKRLYGQSENLQWLPEEPGKLSFIFEQLESLKKDMNANVEKQLAIENFYYQLKQESLT